MADDRNLGKLFVIIFVAVVLAIVAGWYITRVIQHEADQAALSSVNESLGFSTTTSQAGVGISPDDPNSATDDPDACDSGYVLDGNGDACVPTGD